MAAFQYARITCLFGIILWFGAVQADPFFFNSTVGIGSNVNTNLSTGCTSAIMGTVNCTRDLLWMINEDFYGNLGNGNDTVQDFLCNTTCVTSLNTYRSNVVSACSKDPQPLPGVPATYWADSAISTLTTNCMKDNVTHQYCVNYMNNTVGNLTTANNGLDLPTSFLCSNCVLSLFKYMQGSPYSNYDGTLAAVWASIQTTCKYSYPTAIPALAVSLTSISIIAPAYTAPACLSGNTYNVVSGDNCEKIAEAHNVSTGTLIAINSLYTNCSNLLGGQSLCLPQQCSTYIVQGGDTCNAIANKTTASFQQIVSWNPALDTYCSNLLSGQNICISSPGGTPNISTIAGATVTQTAIYATTTASRPSPVASGTTQSCGKYYMIQPGDYCQLVALNQTISLSLFESINPQINSTCGNLLAGYYYCVSPTSSWNATSTVVQAPTSTPQGTTADCYAYYTIQSGDYCAKIESSYSISFQQLQYWNPSLWTNCTNLYLGEAYCINSPDQPPTSTAVAVAASTTPPATSSSVAAASSTKPASSSSAVASTSKVASSSSAAQTSKASSSVGTTTKVASSASTSAKASSSTGSTAKVKRAAVVEEGGVPYGWPGLGAARRAMDGHGLAKHEL